VLAGSGVHMAAHNTRSLIPGMCRPSPDQRRPMAHALRGPFWAALLIVSFGVPARAQTRQFWPEVGTFVKLNDRMRFYFLATTVKKESHTHGRFIGSGI
jgi:hypothetical protein